MHILGVCHIIIEQGVDLYVVQYHCTGSMCNWYVYSTVYSSSVFSPMPQSYVTSICSTPTLTYVFADAILIPGTLDPDFSSFRLMSSTLDTDATGSTP